MKMPRSKTSRLSVILLKDAPPEDALLEDAPHEDALLRSRSHGVPPVESPCFGVALFGVAATGWSSCRLVPGIRRPAAWKRAA